MTGGTSKDTTMGRPRLPETDARSERVVTFLTPPEHQRLSELAQRSKQSLSATCHELIVQAMEPTIIQGGSKID